MASGSRDDFSVGEDGTSSLESTHLWDGVMNGAAADSFNERR